MAGCSWSAAAVANSIRPRRSCTTRRAGPGQPPGTWSIQFGLPPVLLLDGRVLVGDVAVEGSNGHPDVYGSELYDPASGTWTATGGPDRASWRHGHGAAATARSCVRKLSTPVVRPGQRDLDRHREEERTGQGLATARHPAVRRQGARGGRHRLPRHEEIHHLRLRTRPRSTTPPRGPGPRSRTCTQPSKAAMATLLPDGKVLVVTRVRRFGRGSTTRPPEPGPHFLGRPGVQLPRHDTAVGWHRADDRTADEPACTAAAVPVRPAHRVVDDRLEHAPMR